ncbi:LppU/SCO3897 family protein [Actinokineospora sp. NPDC004072]
MTVETPGQPTTPGKKPSVAKRVLGFVVALVVAGGVAYAINYFGSDAAQTKAGDCASVTGTASSPDFSTVDCTAPEANYTVGKVLSSTSESCGGKYDEYTESNRRGPDSKLCLVPILFDGECHQLEGSSMGYPKAPCTTPGAMKIAKIQSEDDCPDGVVLDYPEPKTLYCLKSPTQA